MSKWIFVSLVLALGIKDIGAGIPLMAIAPMVEAGRGLINTILEDIAPGHNQVKDPFALSNETLQSIEKINTYIANQDALKNETLVVIKDTEDHAANVNQRLFEIDEIATKALNYTERTNLNLNKVLIKSQYVLDKLPKITATIETKVTELMNNLADRLKVENKFRTSSKLLAEALRRIQNMYDGYIENLNPKTPLTSMTYENLFNTTLSNGAQELTSNLYAIEDMLTSEKSVLYKGFLDAFNNRGKIMSFEEKCGLSDTYQNRLKRIYNLISINEYRALVMLTIAHKYFETQKLDRSAKNDILTNFREYVNRTSNHLVAMKEAMALASTEIIECDPPEYMLDINTFSLTNLFSIVYLSTDQIGNRCSRSCPKINTVNKLACKKDVKNKDALTVKEYCPKQQCNGRIHDCEVKNYYEFCEAHEGAPTRYHWIESLTDKSSRLKCDGRWVDTMKESKCIECMCQCSAEGAESTATRTISFIPQYTDVANDMVVSNMRLRKKDNVVHIQLEEARILPGGEIDTSTRRWIPLDDLVYRQNTPEGGFWKVKGTEQIGLVFNEDYTFLSHNKKSLYLDEIVVGKDYVVTGARFKNAYENSQLGTPNLSAIQLEIFKTKFVYQNGTLSKDKKEQHISVIANNNTQSQHNDAYSKARTKTLLKKLRLSTDSNKNTELWPPNTELEFKMTAKVGFGKGVIPFFDARPATKQSQVPLSGMAIVYRKRRGFGGFISPKLIGLNHAEYVVSKLTPEEKKKLEKDFLDSADGLSQENALGYTINNSKDESDDVNEIDN
ncbi:GSCOCG00010201001-RA-CDS [Cotesia congregata]|nr:GSCOCG00010201001-RA-CDS [Cotesia congregata]